jgi:hypothetical protein
MCQEKSGHPALASFSKTSFATGFEIPHPAQKMTKKLFHTPVQNFISGFEITYMTGYETRRC